MKDLNEVVEKVKGVEDGVTNLIVPLLKDTINDSNKHNQRLFISNVLLIIVIFIIGITAMMLSVYENNKYAEFLSQFEFETELTQDFNTTDNSAIYNPVINN